MAPPPPLFYVKNGLEMYNSSKIGTSESVMCDVIKICLKTNSKRRSGKETSKKRWIIDFYDVTHDTFRCPKKQAKLICFVCV